jgi:hypothetical protein
MQDRRSEPFGKDELHLDDLAGRTLLTFPENTQPAAVLELHQRMLKAGVAAVNEMDLRELLTLVARLRKTGEFLLSTAASDNPLLRLADTSTLVSTPLADGEVDLQLGIAWRAAEGLKMERIMAVVDGLRPLADPLDEIS